MADDLDDLEVSVESTGLFTTVTIRDRATGTETKFCDRPPLIAPPEQDALEPGALAEIPPGFPEFKIRTDERRTAVGVGLELWGGELLLPRWWAAGDNFEITNAPVDFVLLAAEVYKRHEGTPRRKLEPQALEARRALVAAGSLSDRLKAALEAGDDAAKAARDVALDAFLLGALGTKVWAREHEADAKKTQEHRARSGEGGRRRIHDRARIREAVESAREHEPDANRSRIKATAAAAVGCSVQTIENVARDLLPTARPKRRKR